MDWSKGMSGELLRVMTLAGGSGWTVVWLGGSSSSGLPLPSPTRSTASASKWPVRFEIAPRVLSGVMAGLYGYTAPPPPGQAPLFGCREAVDAPQIREPAHPQAR